MLAERIECDDDGGRLALLLAVWFLAGSPINAQHSVARSGAADPLRVEDALAVRTFADRQQLMLSSDGELVAFALIDPGRAARLAEPGRSSFTSTGVPELALGADVFVANTRTGVTRDLTAGRGSSWAPAWSPDGRYLAFYSDRDGVARLWFWDRERDRLRRLTGEVVRPYWGFEQPRWSPDGRRILAKLLPAGQTLRSAQKLLPEPAASRRSAEQPRGTVTATVFSSHDSAATRSTPARQSIDSTRSFLNAALADLALVEVESGRVRRVARRVRAMAVRFSPDGARIAFTVRQPYSTTGEISYGLYDLLVVDAVGGDPRLIASRLRQSYGQSFSWSPSGRRLAYASGAALHVVAVDDTARSQRFSPEILSASQEYRAPLWLDDEKLVVPARDTLWMASIASGALSALGTVRGWDAIEVFTSADAQHTPADSVVLVAARDPVTKRMGFHSFDLFTGRTALKFQGDLGIGSRIRRSCHSQSA